MKAAKSSFPFPPIIPESTLKRLFCIRYLNCNKKSYQRSTIPLPYRFFITIKMFNPMKLKTIQQ